MASIAVTTKNLAKGFSPSHGGLKPAATSDIATVTLHLRGGRAVLES